MAFGSPAFGRSSAGLRILNVLVGIAMIAYGIYLGFIFRGGHYFIFFKAFVVPVVLVVRSVLSIRRSKRATVGVPTAPAPLVWTDPGQPYHSQPQDQWQPPSSVPHRP